MFQDVDSGMEKYTNLTNYPVGTTLRCSSTNADFVISASLKSTGEFWCIDSTGASMEITAVDHLTAHPDGDTACN